MCLSQTFHNYKIVFKSESLILFKLNKFMVAIGKKAALGDLKFSLKDLIWKLYLAIFPVPYSLISF